MSSLSCNSPLPLPPSSEDIELEDLEDGLNMKNQWLIKTPRKSFFVSASSSEEKRAWMEHIEDCRTKRLQKAGRKPSISFAVTWIPDRASAICMRCFGKFNITHRRHHCRSCGFVVCNPCSKARAVLPNISSKPVRICKRCTLGLQDQGVEEELRPRVDSDGTNCVSEEEDQLAPEYEPSSDEEDEERMGDRAPSNWVDSRQPTSTYVFLNPDHERPAMM